MSSLPNTNNNNNDDASSTVHLEKLFLDTMMTRLNLRNPDNTPAKSFEEYLYGSDDDDDEDEPPRPYQGGKQAIYREESRIESEVIKLILSGEGDTLKPNSGEAIPIRESNICVGCHEEEEGEYLVWEWHGHIMAYTDEHGFSPEYIYGNYFQRIVPAETPPVTPPGTPPLEGDVVSNGLKDLIDEDDADVDADAVSTTPARILHRSLNAGSAPPRFYEFRR